MVRMGLIVFLATKQQTCKHPTRKTKEMSKSRCKKSGLMYVEIQEHCWFRSDFQTEICWVWESFSMWLGLFFFLAFLSCKITLVHILLEILTTLCSQPLLIRAGSSDTQLSLSRRMTQDINPLSVSPPTNQGSSIEGQRKRRRLWHYNSLPVFFLPPLSNPQQSPPSTSLFPFSSLFLFPSFSFTSWLLFLSQL